MNRYYVQYHSRTLASLQNIKDQLSDQNPVCIFQFTTTPTKISLSDSIQKDNLYTGLNIIVYQEASSMNEARLLSQDYTETLLTLISLVTLTPCDLARLISIVDVTNKNKFPARFNTYRSSQNILHGSHAVINMSHIGAVFQAFNEGKYLYPERVATALRWFRKGLLEQHPIDRFLCYWFSIEFLSCILRRELKQKVNNPDLWDGIRNIFQNEVKCDEWENILKARQDIVHGNRELDKQFIGELKLYIQPMLKGLVFAIGNILKLDQSIIDSICSKKAEDKKTGIETILVGTLDNQSSDFQVITKDYPSVEVQNESFEYFLDNKGNLNVKGSPSYTFHLATGVVFSMRGFELWNI